MLALGCLVLLSGFVCGNPVDVPEVDNEAPFAAIGVIDHDGFHTVNSTDLDRPLRHAVTVEDDLIFLASVKDEGGIHRVVIGSQGHGGLSLSPGDPIESSLRYDFPANKARDSVLGGGWVRLEPLPPGREAGELSVRITGEDFHGNVTTTKTVKLEIHHEPLAQIEVTPSSIYRGQAAEIYWQSLHGEPTINGDPVDKDGQEDVRPTETTEYVLLVKNPGGWARDSVTLVVMERGEPSVELVADPSTIDPGGTATLRYTTEWVRYLKIDPIDLTIEIPTLDLYEGSTTVSPSSTTSYTARVVWPSTSDASDRATVTVEQPPVDPGPEVDYWTVQMNLDPTSGNYAALVDYGGYLAKSTIVNVINGAGFSIVLAHTDIFGATASATLGDVGSSAETHVFDGMDVEGIWVAVPNEVPSWPPPSYVSVGINAVN